MQSFAKVPLAQQIQCCVSLSMSDFEERWLPRYGKWSTFTRHSFAIVIVGGGAKVSDGGRMENLGLFDTQDQSKELVSPSKKINVICRSSSVWATIALSSAYCR